MRRKAFHQLKLYYTVYSINHIWNKLYYFIMVFARTIAIQFTKYAAINNKSNLLYYSILYMYNDVNNNNNNNNDYVIDIFDHVFFSYSTLLFIRHLVNHTWRMTNKHRIIIYTLSFHVLYFGCARQLFSNLCQIV